MNSGGFTKQRSAVERADSDVPQPHGIDNAAERKSSSCNEMDSQPNGTFSLGNATADDCSKLKRENHEITVSPCSTGGDAQPRENKKRRTSPEIAAKKETKWLGMYEELKSYKTQFGHCIVPRGFAFNTRLASWVAEQRKQHKLMENGKASSMTSERVKLLEELGFAWNAQEAAWNKHYNDLCKYKDENGDCLVSLNCEKYPQLGLWVKEQRRHHALMKEGMHSHMNAKREQALKEIGFCWDSHEAVWWDKFRELEHFKKDHGHCVVPVKFESNPKLGTWVNHQRRQCKLMLEGKPCHMTEDRVRALDRIGFKWFSLPENQNKSKHKRRHSHSHKIMK